MIGITAQDSVKVTMISFRRGDYIIESLREYLRDNEIDAALITSGIGSLDVCKLHTIKHTNLPPEDEHFELEGPLELSSLLGSVSGGEPHIHVTLHDVQNDKIHIGHLEPGSRCCYRVEMGLIELRGVKTKRVTDKETDLIDIVEE